MEPKAGSYWVHRAFPEVHVTVVRVPHRSNFYLPCEVVASDLEHLPIGSKMSIHFAIFGQSDKHTWLPSSAIEAMRAGAN